MILEPLKIKSATFSTVSPSISHEMIGPDAMILVFWMLSFFFSFFFYCSGFCHTLKWNSHGFTCVPHPDPPLPPPSPPDPSRSSQCTRSEHLSYCKVISLQLIKINEKKKKERKDTNKQKKKIKSWLKIQHSKNKDHGIRSNRFMANRRGNNGNSDRLYFLGLLNHCIWWLQPWN